VCVVRWHMNLSNFTVSTLLLLSAALLINPSCCLSWLFGRVHFLLSSRCTVLSQVKLDASGCRLKLTRCEVKCPPALRTSNSCNGPRTA